MPSSSSHTAWDPWTYGSDVDVSAGQRNLVGFEVEADAYRDRAYRDRLADYYRKFRY